MNENVEAFLGLGFPVSNIHALPRYLSSLLKKIDSNFYIIENFKNKFLTNNMKQVEALNS